MHTLETGGTSLTTNVGSVRNRGIEIGLTTENIVTRDWHWTTALTFAHNDNEVLEINGTGNLYNGTSPTGNLLIGEPYNNIYSYEFGGIVSTHDMTVPDHEIARLSGFTPGETVKQYAYYNKCYGWVEGSPIIVDRDGNGKFDDADKRIYRSDPRWTGSLTKVCLAAGWDLQTTLTDAAQGTYTVNSTVYFQKAAQVADDVIGGQQLTMAFEDKWAPANEGNNEEIFAVQYERNGFPGDVVTGGHNRQGTYGSQMGNPVENGMKATGSSLSPSAKSIYLWAKGDQRLDATFMMTTYNYFGKWQNEGYFAYYHKTDAQRATMPIADKYFPWYVTEAEVTGFITDHKAQLAKNNGALTVQVHRLASQSTLYAIKQDGTKDKTFTETYSDYLRGQHGSAVVPAVKKFDDPETPQQNNATGYRNIVLLHLSDIYLTAAEAYLMAGNETKALQRVNAVRARAKASQLASFADYVPDYETDVRFTITPLDVVLDEQARELYAENTRWMDLRRTRQLVRYNVEFNPSITSVADMSNPKGEVKWLRPIPAAEIETNTAITVADQNPGY